MSTKMLQVGDSHLIDSIIDFFSKRARHKVDVMPRTVSLDFASFDCINEDTLSSNYHCLFGPWKFQ